MKYLYHLTRPEYLDRILSEGLKPIVGDNSKLVDDMVPASHMCERKYLPYWNLLLDRPGALLKIDTSYLCEDRIQERNYHLYREKIYDELIPKEAVSVANVYRIQSIEDIKNENIFTDEGRLNKRESILHCIDDSGNTMDVYIDPNKSYWFDENDNNILSTDGIVSELLFSDDGETSETGVIKYTVNDKTVYIKEVDIEEIYESED